MDQASVRGQMEGAALHVEAGVLASLLEAAKAWRRWRHTRHELAQTLRDVDAHV
ncbi:hypothetical protein [Burkholderia sp. Ax-1724]|uniref:hypothetical protein n=1 Tax=Burkholderia sp. Ax-1724 TaxID=2608336 RepID=UPI00141DF164|nr:hypothetical protein [Burkholderia sp. Ax-1724]